jgi:tripartite-type tricarboxylate transporter receptor subunit TctC
LCGSLASTVRAKTCIRCRHVDVGAVLASPYHTLADLTDAALAKPGELTNASVGPASTQHIAFELFKLRAKINVIYVPFNGNGPAINELLGGDVDVVMANYSEWGRT